METDKNHRRFYARLLFPCGRMEDFDSFTNLDSVSLNYSLSTLISFKNSTCNTRVLDGGRREMFHMLECYLSVVFPRCI